MRDRAASHDGARGGSRPVVTVMILHDVDDVEHGVSSPRRMELFGPLGMTGRTFVIDRSPGPASDADVRAPTDDDPVEALR